MLSYITALRNVHFIMVQMINSMHTRQPYKLDKLKLFYRLIRLITYPTIFLLELFLTSWMAFPPFGYPRGHVALHIRSMQLNQGLVNYVVRVQSNAGLSNTSVGYFHKAFLKSISQRSFHAEYILL